MRGARYDLEWDQAATWVRDIARVDAAGTPLDSALPSRLTVYLTTDTSRTQVLAFDGQLIPHPRAKVGSGVRAVRFARSVDQLREVVPGYYEHEMIITYPLIGQQVIRGHLLVLDRLGMGRSA